MLKYIRIQHYILSPFLLLSGIVYSGRSFSQSTPPDSTANLSLSQCISYAIQHQPTVQQTLIRTQVANATNKINTSGWYPQVNVSANLQHYIERPTSLSTINGVQTPIKTSVTNTSTPTISVTQTIFNPSLIYASRIASLNVKAAEQSVDSSKIELVSNVSKSFYSLLLTLEQINSLQEDTARLGESMRTAYHQYVGGIVDETDYQQATITLNTSLVQLKQAVENIWPLYATLKQYMGFPDDQQFNVTYDSTELMKNIDIDSTAELQYNNRIEVKQLAVQADLQKQATRYWQKTYYLPTLSAFYTNNFAFQNSEFTKLYNTAYPNSMVGLTLSMPVFTGFYRTQNVRRSRLQEQILDWTQKNLKQTIYTQYATALAAYKGNAYNMRKMKENADMARRVYFVVDLQYKQGIVPYLNVITAESNLRTSELLYLNALYTTLSSKIDYQKAMGTITY